MLSPKLTLSLLATSAVVLLANPLLAQTPTEKSTVAAPVANTATKADPDMAKVLNALAELGPKRC